MEDLEAYHTETLEARPEDLTAPVWHSLYVSRRFMRLRFGEVYQGETWKKRSGARFSWIQLSPGVTEQGKRTYTRGSAVVVASPSCFPAFDRDHRDPGASSHGDNHGECQWHLNVPLRWSGMRWSLSRDRTRINFSASEALPWTRQDEASKATKGGGGLPGGGEQGEGGDTLFRGEVV